MFAGGGVLVRRFVTGGAVFWEPDLDELREEERACGSGAGPLVCCCRHGVSIFSD